MLKNVAINSAGIFSAAALALLPALLISYPLLSNTQDTFADMTETDSNSVISLSSTGFYINTAPSATGSFATNSIKVNVSTTSSSGYTLKMSSGKAYHVDYDYDSSNSDRNDRVFYEPGSCSIMPVGDTIYDIHGNYRNSKYYYKDITGGITGSDMVNSAYESYGTNLQGTGTDKYYLGGHFATDAPSGSIYCFNVNNSHKSSSDTTTTTANSINSNYFTPPTADEQIYSKSSAGSTSDLPITFAFVTRGHQTSGNYVLEVKLTATPNNGGGSVVNYTPCPTCGGCTTCGGGGTGGTGGSSGNTNTAYFVDSNNQPITTMQQMTKDICDGAPTPTVNATYLDTTSTYIANNTGFYVPAVNLTDTRDGQTYLVAKLADGNCWMLEDLKTTKESLTSHGTTTLTSANTNMRDSNRSFSVASLPATATINSDDTVTGWVDTATSSSIAKKTTSNKTRVLYNWHAAILEDEGTTVFNADNIGVYDSDNNPIERDSSICPKGWRLPNAQGNKSWHRLLGGGRGYYELIPSSGSYVVATITNNQLTRLRNDPIKLNYTGHIKGGTTEYDHGTERAQYWTRTTIDFDSGNDNEAYSLYVGKDTMEAGTRNYNNKKGGLAIRCVNSVVQ